jgi:Ras family protein
MRAILMRLSAKAFDALLREMQKEYNPAPEKKKSSWFSWGRT